MSRLSSPPLTRRSTLLAVLKPHRIVYKCTDANCSSFHLRVFLGLSNPQGQRQTSTISIPRDNFGERKAKFNLETSRTTQMKDRLRLPDQPIAQQGIHTRGYSEARYGGTHHTNLATWWIMKP
jgi:hypothetical protein